MDYVTTPAQFEQFKKECRYWLDLFLLGDWEVRFWHRDLQGTLASCAVNRTAKICDLSLGLIWGIEPTEDLIDDAASHEVMELLLDDFEYSLLYITNEEEREHCRERDRHAIIHRLQRAFKSLMEL